MRDMERAMWAVLVAYHSIRIIVYHIHVYISKELPTQNSEPEGAFMDSWLKLAWKLL